MEVTIATGEGSQEARGSGHPDRLLQRSGPPLRRAQIHAGYCCRPIDAGGNLHNRKPCSMFLAAAATVTLWGGPV